MKLIIFTTCKPFEGDDAWRQEQAIKSWTLLQGMEKKIIVVGNEKGTKEICDKYDLIHEPEVKNLSGIPYLHSMLEIGAKHSEPDDYLLWTNSDMIYYDDMIVNILSFDYIKKMNNIKNFSLIGGRIDWHNPRILEDLSKKHFLSNLHLNERKTSRSITEICQTESTFYECSQHALCGIDYVIHSPTTYIDKIDKNLVIAGTRHDMILVGTALSNGYFTCNITNTNLVVHQNHGYALGGHNSNELTKNVLIPNNQRCNGIMARIDQSPVFTMADPNTKKIRFLTNKPPEIQKDEDKVSLNPRDIKKYIEIPQEIKNIFKDKRVVIVGPAPNIINKNRGPFIDTFDIVCVCNETYTLNNDYGSRIDCLFHTCNSDSIGSLLINKDKIKNKNVGILFATNKGNNTYNKDAYTKYTNTVKEIDSKIICFDMSSFSIFCDSICLKSKKKGQWARGGFHTGTFSLAFLLSLNLKELRIEGMSFYNSGKFGQSWHPDYNGINPAHILGNTHTDCTIQNEIDFINDLIKDASFKVDFDESYCPLIKNNMS